MMNRERENARLRWPVADLSLEKQVLADVARETCSLFGVHRSTFFRAHPSSARERSCGA